MSVELEETQPASRESSPTLPQRISKYELGERLGAGGNGVVLLARDVTLDRKVAIKLLRGGATEEANQRLLREAQAAAKLSHENVIVVHEVGSHDGGVFVAMEYVAGGTLRDYGRTHDWRGVLDAYRRAGRGLAAAHAAGLVHRDFKPDNVLVGDDGRLRVTDFGLVAVSGTHGTSPGALDGSAPPTAPDQTLTRTGTVMGTPRYMAPEQHEGAAVDARADQFAFCVALYEALYGRLPFDGETYDVIASHVCAGEIVPPPVESPVPPAIRDAILRGLALAPGDRWPAMPALLDALTTPVPPPPRRRRWWIAAVAVALVAVAVAAVLVNRDRDAGAATAEAAYKKGRAAYERGDFPAAVAAFKHGFAMQEHWDAHSAPYLYDVAQAYRQMGDCADSSAAFKQYLSLMPTLEAARRARIEEMIQQLDSCVAQQGSAVR